MKSKTIVFFIFLCTVIMFGSALAGRRQMSSNKEDSSMDVTDFSVYYDLKTNATIKNMMPRPWYQPGWRLRLPFRAGTCSCETYQCSCCAGMRVSQFGFDRQTCAVLNFNQDEGLLGLNVQMSNQSVLNKTFSVANPPPFCMPIPIPGLPLPIPLFDMCIRLFDVTLNWDKMHVCMDWDTRIDKAPVVILHFDCMDMGTGGISLSKPGSSNEMVTESSQQNPDVFDPVTEKVTTSTEASVSNNDNINKV